VLLGGILQTLITYKMINNETYPFSNSFEFAQETDGFKMLLLSIFTGVFVIAHLVSTFINYGVYIYIAVLLLFIVMGWRIIFPKTIK
jgi:ABC-2 type transport system permease protein